MYLVVYFLRVFYSTIINFSLLFSFEKFRINLHDVDSRLRSRRCVSAREKGEMQGMADDPVWPDPFRPRIVAPAKGKKGVSRKEPHGVLAMHESRYHAADYLQEIFSPFALNVYPQIYLHLSLYSSMYLQILDGFGVTQF